MAIVGALAAAVCLGSFWGEELSASFAAQVSPEIVLAFQGHLAKHQRSFLTKSEFLARQTIFRDNYELVKQHN
jgi:hypothetical protein